MFKNTRLKVFHESSLRTMIVWVFMVEARRGGTFLTPPPPLLFSPLFSSPLFSFLSSVVSVSWLDK